MNGYLLILFVVFPFFGFAQSPAAYNYSASNKMLRFHDIVPDGNCGSIILGYDQTDNFYFVSNLNENLDTVWTSYLDFSPYLVSPNGKIAKGDDGIFFLMGKNILPPSSNRFYNIIGKLDFSGHLIWIKAVEANFYGLAFLEVLQNKVYCAFPGINPDTLQLYKFDSSGNQLWSKSLTSQPGFVLPSVNSIQEDSTGNLSIIGKLSSWANLSSLGTFEITISPSSHVLNSYRIFGLSSTELTAIEGAYNSFDRYVFFSGQSRGMSQTHYIRVQRLDKITGDLFSKNFVCNDSLVFLKTSFSFDNNRLIITGRANGLDSPEKSFHLILDTNLNILSSCQFSSITDSLSLSLNKTIISCGGLISIGSIEKDLNRCGYLVNKVNFTDSVCFQGNLQFQDSIVFDSMGNLSILDFPSYACFDIAATTKHIPLSRNFCAVLDGIDEVPSEMNVFHLYPNPTISMLKVSGLLNGDRIVFLNSIGQLQQQFPGSAYFEVDISSWPKGMYFYSVLDKEQKVLHSGKFIKN